MVGLGSVPGFTTHALVSIGAVQSPVANATSPPAAWSSGINSSMKFMSSRPSGGSALSFWIASLNCLFTESTSGRLLSVMSSQPISGVMKKCGSRTKILLKRNASTFGSPVGSLVVVVSGSVVLVVGSVVDVDVDSEPALVVGSVVDVEVEVDVDVDVDGSVALVSAESSPLHATASSSAGANSVRVRCGSLIMCAA